MRNWCGRNQVAGPPIGGSLASVSQAGRMGRSWLVDAKNGTDGSLQFCRRECVSKIFPEYPP
eukprot:3819953-Prorocentrum_lima.AAC.1